MKLLVRATNWIGDAVMSLPAIRALAGAYPGASLHVLARPSVADLYGRERGVSKIIPLEGAGGLRDLLAKGRQVAKLRAERYDLAVLLPNSFESAFLCRAAGAKHVVGYNRDGRRPLLSLAVPVPRPGETPPHQRFYYMELLRRAALIPSLPPSDEILLDGLPEARACGQELFRARQIPSPVIGVSPGAAYGSAKRWLPDRFADAARQIAARCGGSVVVFGTGAERSVCEQVAALANGTSVAGATTLREYLDMCAATSLMITNDSGAMHVAYASGVPSVTIFGPTKDQETGPVGPLARMVRHPVECSPCMLRECPIDHRCMTGVSTDNVVNIATSLLSGQIV